ncbi:MAG: winged helix-turn-helix transcriptional regulator [Clostridia bacterium]|nr:winged helix-turn-helix transcriptional regulator [Clostridia bacterium]
MPLQVTMQALADPVRREILNMLKKQSLTAGEIAAAFSISAPAVSRHLAVLKRAGLLLCEREGKHVRYILSTSVLEDVLCFLIDLKGGASVQEDCGRQKLV